MKLRSGCLHGYVLVLVHALCGGLHTEFPESLYWDAGPDVTDRALCSESNDEECGEVYCVSRFAVPPEDTVVLEENTRFDEAEGDAVADDAKVEVLQVMRRMTFLKWGEQ